VIHRFARCQRTLSRRARVARKVSPETLGGPFGGGSGSTRGMASTPLITFVSIMVAILTLVLLNQFVKREASNEADQE
jgi:hypothetical protein